MGYTYCQLALLLPEVSGFSIDEACNMIQSSTWQGNDCVPNFIDQTLHKRLWSGNYFGKLLSLAGKLMGYAGVGAPDSYLASLAHAQYARAYGAFCYPFGLVAAACSSETGQKYVAASIQA